MSYLPTYQPPRANIDPTGRSTSTAAPYDATDAGYLNWLSGGANSGGDWSGFANGPQSWDLYQQSLAANPAEANPNYNYGPGGGQPTAPPGSTAIGSGSPGQANPNAPWAPTSGQLQAFAPRSVTDFGGIPQVSPTFATAATATAPGTPNAASYNPALISGATVDPNSAQRYLDQYSQMLTTALAPGEQQQRQQLQDSLAARGISSSGAAGELEGNLLSGQAAARASALAPLVSQGFGYQQQDLTTNAGYEQQARTLNQEAQNSAQSAYTNTVNALTSQGYSYQQAVELANQQAQQQATLTNQQTANAAANTNAAYYGAAVGTDAQSYNNYLAMLEQQGYGNGSGLQAAYLNSFGPNTGVTSAYGNATGAIGSTAGNAFGAATGAQGQALSGAFGAAGAYFGGA